MKSATRIFLTTLASTAWAVAASPTRPGLTKYQGLWNNSPFTSKPIVDPGVPEADPLEDLALLGVSPIANGYRVTLINKKKPEERKTVDSDKPSDEFKIISVVRKAGDPLATVVRMTAGSHTGNVGFDEKLLTLAPPPVAKPQAPPGVQPVPGQQMPQAMNNPQARQPRPRVVPPPAPSAQPAQPQQPQHSDRPDRRGSR